MKWAWDSTDIPFDVPNLRVENGAATAQVRIGWLRSVANIYHAFAVQTFADELAHAAGRDPVDYMLELIGPPRVVDITSIKHPNYGANYELTRTIRRACEKSLKSPLKNQDGAKRNSPRAPAWASRSIAAS